jgi:hypothetical protein
MSEKLSSLAISLGVSYCEVLVREIAPDDVPVIMRNPCVNPGDTIVNIVGEYFTSTKFYSNTRGRRIDYYDLNVKSCMSLVRCAQHLGSWVEVHVPCVDGCGEQLCADLSDRLYAALLVYNSETNSKTVHVLCVDSAPAIVVSRDVNKCAISWIANIIQGVVRDMLRDNAHNDVEGFMLRHPSMGVIMRVCNGRFLKRLSMDDFKKEVMKHIAEEEVHYDIA